MNASRYGSRAGFTLVELLMVILIISMLIALLLPAVNAARNRAIETAVISDVEQLTIGFNDTKNKWSAYPPDAYWTGAEIETALRRAFPGMTAAATVEFRDVVLQLSAAEAATFWLGAFEDGNGNRGFSKDPRDPLGPGLQREAPFQMEETRLLPSRTITRGGGRPDIHLFTYRPPCGRAQDVAPYAYFAARPNGWYFDPNFDPPPTYGYSHPGATGVAIPYMRSSSPFPPPPANARFVNDTSFQIICGGIDNDYGARIRKGYPSGDRYNSGDNDNIVSFSGRRLGDAQP